MHVGLVKYIWKNSRPKGRIPMRSLIQISRKRIFRDLKYLPQSKPLHSSHCHKMRLNYVPDPPKTASPEEEEIVQRIRERRGERGLISLDRALLHSPPVANGWYVA